MADSSSLIGQNISHDHILAKLGAGGMGVVYKALDEQLQRTVALKFLPEDLNANSTERDSLLREARAASGLDHPNVGVIYGLEEDGAGRYFISMGYYEGETLSERLSAALLQFTIPSTWPSRSRAAWRQPTPGI